MERESSYSITITWYIVFFSFTVLYILFRLLSLLPRDNSKSNKINENLLKIIMGHCYSNSNQQNHFNQKKIDLTHFYIGKHIGSGGFGNVFECRNKINGKTFAIKVISKSNKNFYKNGHYKKRFIFSLINERAILINNHISSYNLNKNNPNHLLHLNYAFQHRKYFYFIFSLINGQSISNIISKILQTLIQNHYHYNHYTHQYSKYTHPIPTPIITNPQPHSNTTATTSPALNTSIYPYLDESVIVYYAAQLVLAMEDLHTRNILHMDIKPDNILVQDSGNIVLIDYGLGFISSKPLTHPSKSYISTPPFHHHSSYSSLTHSIKGQHNPSPSSSTFSDTVHSIDHNHTHNTTAHASHHSIVHDHRKLSTTIDMDKQNNKDHILEIDDLLKPTFGFIGGGTRGYQAPESLNNNTGSSNSTCVGKKCIGPWCDLYSFTVTIYTLVHGHKLRTLNESSNNADNAQVHENGETPEYVFHESMSPDLKDFLNKILVLDPKKRLGIIQSKQEINGSITNSSSHNDNDLYIDYQIIKSHPLFKHINWDDLSQSKMKSPLSNLPFNLNLLKDNPKSSNENDQNIFCNDSEETLRLRMAMEKDSHNNKSAPSNKYVFIDGWDYNTQINYQLETNNDHTYTNYNNPDSTIGIDGLQQGQIPDLLY